MQKAIDFATVNQPPATTLIQFAAICQVTFTWKIVARIVRRSDQAVRHAYLILNC